MIDVATRFTYSDTPKATLKHASKKARRRQDRDELHDLAPAPQTTEHTPHKPDYVQAPYALLVWDDGLDYNEDGTAYLDDAPGDHPHSYHLTREAAEMEQAWLEHHGCNKSRLTIAEGYWVPFWDAHRIPTEPFPTDDPADD